MACPQVIAEFSITLPCFLAQEDMFHILSVPTQAQQTKLVRLCKVKPSASGVVVDIPLCPRTLKGVSFGLYSPGGGLQHHVLMKDTRAQADQRL